jgi:hypothetical protein
MGGIRIMTVVLGGALLLAAGEARAGHICELVEEGLVEVDAMLDEWQDLAPLRRGAGNPDASFEMRCAYDARRLYIAVAVRDDRLVRTGRGNPAGEDNLYLALGGASAGKRFTLRVFPGAPGFRAKKVGGGPQVVVEDSLQEDGWSLEVSIPLARIPGWGPSTPLLLGELVYNDVDAGKGGVRERRRFAGSLHFSSHVPALRGLLAVIKTRVADLRLDRLVDIDGLPGSERVVAGGRFIGVLSDSFGFIELPVKAASDVIDVQLVDLDGSGRASILAHFRQRGGGGSRELVTLWNLGAQNQFEMTFGFEVAVSLGERQLVNRWALVPAGERRAEPAGKGNKRKGPMPRGLDIVVEVSEADNQGWDARSFAQVIQATDVRPIMTPWGERRAVVYYFDGLTPLEAAARPAGRVSR